MSGKKYPYTRTHIYGKNKLTKAEHDCEKNKKLQFTQVVTLVCICSGQMHTENNED